MRKDISSSVVSDPVQSSSHIDVQALSSVPVFNSSFPHQSCSFRAHRLWDLFIFLPALHIHFFFSHELGDLLSLAPIEFRLRVLRHSIPFRLGTLVVPFRRSVPSLRLCFQQAQGLHVALALESRTNEIDN
jgi:hypothetical protein